MIIKSFIIPPVLAISALLVGIGQPVATATKLQNEPVSISAIDVPTASQIQASQLSEPFLPSSTQQNTSRCGDTSACMPAPVCTDTIGNGCPRQQKPAGISRPAPVCTDTIGRDCPVSTSPPNRCAYPMTCPEPVDNDDVVSTSCATNTPCGIVPTRCTTDAPCGDTPGPTQDYQPPACTKYDACGANPADNEDQPTCHIYDNCGAQPAYDRP